MPVRVEPKPKTEVKTARRARRNKRAVLLVRCDVVHCVFNAHHLLRLLFRDFHLFVGGVIPLEGGEGGAERTRAIREDGEQLRGKGGSGGGGMIG